MQPIERHAVESASIVSVGYQTDTGTLEVEFNNGAVYRYSDVSAEVFQKMQVADSKGQYLHRYIRGFYSYQRH